MAEWLKHNRHSVLRIRRPVADVAYSMLNRRWNYPARLFPNEVDKDRALIYGLVQAERALDSIESVELEYDDLIDDEGVVFDTIQQFYPNVKEKEIRYINAGFKEARKKIMTRRTTERYKDIQQIAAEMNIRTVSSNEA